MADWGKGNINVLYDSIACNWYKRYMKIYFWHVKFIFLLHFYLTSWNTVISSFNKFRIKFYYYLKRVHSVQKILFTRREFTKFHVTLSDVRVQFTRFSTGPSNKLVKKKIWSRMVIYFKRPSITCVCRKRSTTMYAGFQTTYPLPLPNFDHGEKQFSFEFAGHSALSACRFPNFSLARNCDKFRTSWPTAFNTSENNNDRTWLWNKKSRISVERGVQLL